MLRPMRSHDAAHPGAPQAAPSPAELFHRIFELLADMEGAQRAKVVDLARRLIPTLTAEDIRNPHDFPDLDDPDWHFEDGQLTGIQSVQFALRALSGEVLPHGEQEAREADREEGPGQGSG